MPEFEVSVDVAVAPETAWRVIRDPCAITRWYPLYVRCHAVRDMRILERVDGGRIEERFLSRDEQAMTLTSTVLGGLPVTRHRNVFRVEPLHPGCRVTWWTHADAAAGEGDPGEWMPAEHLAALHGLRTYLEDQ